MQHHEAGAATGWVAEPELSWWRGPPPPLPPLLLSPPMHTKQMQGLRHPQHEISLSIL